MAVYKYETHVHTAESSRCGMIDAVEMVRFYKDIGYKEFVLLITF